jgi:hypothetical protein
MSGIYKRRKRPFRRSAAPYLPVLFFPIALFFLECVVRFFLFGSFFGRGLGYTLLFSVPAGMVLSILCALWGQRINRILSVALMSLVTLWYMAQTVYYTIFKTFLTLYSIGGAGKVLAFWREIVAGIGAAFVPLLLLAIPLALLCALGAAFTPVSRASGRLLGGLALLAAGFQLLAVLAGTASASGVLSPKTLYEESFIPELSVSTFGVATTFRLDARRASFRRTERRRTVTPAPEPEPEPSAAHDPVPTPQTIYEPNVMDIDFERLIAEGNQRNAAGDAPVLQCAQAYPAQPVHRTVRREKPDLSHGRRVFAPMPSTLRSPPPCTSWPIPALCSPIFIIPCGGYPPRTGNMRPAPLSFQNLVCGRSISPATTICIFAWAISLAGWGIPPAPITTTPGTITAGTSPTPTWVTTIRAWATGCQ